MTASVASFLSQAQKKGSQLPPAVSGTLLLAAVRLSEAKNQAVRPYQLLVDDDGAIDLLTGEPPSGDGYSAPELRNGAVLADDPRVLVFAAGALGYELVTLTPPRAGEAVGTELQGPLAKIIRKAMADRHGRFKTLREMARAIQEIQGPASAEEQRLVLAAVASSTPLPAAQKLAKLELQKASTPEPPSPPPEDDDARQSGSRFTQTWDPLETQPEPEAPPAPERHHRALDPVEPPAQAEAGPSLAELRANLEAEKKAREDLSTTVRTRIGDLAELGTRISLLEEQVRASVNPPLSAAAAVSREVRELLDQRRFAEAERALKDPTVQNDAVLQFWLGQVLSGKPDATPVVLARAEAAFRRAGELDSKWAEPRARLGALLVRQGKNAEAGPHLKAALELDPFCAEALAAIPEPPRRAPLLPVVLSSAGSAVATALLVFALRPSAPPPAPAQKVTTAAIALRPPPAPPAPAPAPAPRLELPLPPAGSAQSAVATPVAVVRTDPPKPVPQKPRAERKPQPEPAVVEEARPEPKRSRKVAASAASRAAAEAESANGDKALRAFDTATAQSAFASAVRLDPSLPSAHRGMGMVYVLLGKTAEAKAEYSKYLELSPDAPDKEQITRLLAR